MRTQFAPPATCVCVSTRSVCYVCAYCAVCLCAGLDRKSPEYARLKEERSQALWRAVEKIIPDVRRRAEVVMVGTPLTQARFLRRDRGTYGGTGWIGAGGMAAAPSPVTPLNGLLLVGDSTFPGPGVPAVAAGGMGAAHALVPFWKHCETLDVVCPR